jgi:hypothetical protein
LQNCPVICSRDVYILKNNQLEGHLAKSRAFKTLGMQSKVKVSSLHCHW